MKTHTIVFKNTGNEVLSGGEFSVKLRYGAVKLAGLGDFVQSSSGGVVKTSGISFSDKEIKVSYDNFVPNSEIVYKVTVVCSGETDGNEEYESEYELVAVPPVANEPYIDPTSVLSVQDDCGYVPPKVIGSSIVSPQGNTEDYEFKQEILNTGEEPSGNLKYGLVKGTFPLDMGTLEVENLDTYEGTLKVLEDGTIVLGMTDMSSEDSLYHTDVIVRARVSIRDTSGTISESDDINNIVKVTYLKKNKAH